MLEEETKVVVVVLLQEEAVGLLWEALWKQRQRLMRWLLLLWEKETEKAWAVSELQKISEGTQERKATARGTAKEAQTEMEGALQRQ